MKILITGGTGFIGTNLASKIREKYRDSTLILCNSKTTPRQLADYAKVCDAVFYLAAIHRSPVQEDFKRINNELLSTFLQSLENAKNTCPIVFTSSRQAGENSPYGESKINAEALIWGHASKCLSSSVVYRLTNTFGRHARPNGHSVVATFCYNIQRNLPIVISNPNTIMQFHYIDDVVTSLLHSMDQCLNSDAHINDHTIYRLPQSAIYRISLGELADKLHAFKLARDSQFPVSVKSLFDKRLLYTFDGYSKENFAPNYIV